MKKGHEFRITLQKSKFFKSVNLFREKVAFKYHNDQLSTTYLTIFTNLRVIFDIKKKQLSGLVELSYFYGCFLSK